MNVIFRVDASVDMGSGHVMRCLTLADELKRVGADASFICRDAPGNLCDYVEEYGFTVYRLPDEGRASEDWATDAQQTIATLKGMAAPIQWLVVDHYVLDARWEAALREMAANVLVIDDLANRPHHCDLLLDQNLHERMKMRYGSLIPSSCRQLLGPSFALLRPQFRQARGRSGERDGVIRRLHVCFGGSDPTNETIKALQAIDSLQMPEIAVDVVVGNANPHRELVERYCESRPYAYYHCQVENMAELMAKADLAIGAGGVSMWERCCTGLPAITIVVAENQREATHAAAGRGAVRNLGWHADVQPRDIAQALQDLLEEPASLKRMGEQAKALVNFESSTSIHPVVQAMLEVES